MSYSTSLKLKSLMESNEFSYKKHYSKQIICAAYSCYDSKFLFSFGTSQIFSNKLFEYRFNGYFEKVLEIYRLKCALHGKKLNFNNIFLFSIFTTIALFEKEFYVYLPYSLSIEKSLLFSIFAIDFPIGLLSTAVI